MIAKFSAIAGRRLVATFGNSVSRTAGGLVLLLSLSLFGSIAVGAETALSAPPDRIELSNDPLPLAAGGERSLSALAGKKATVLVFLSTECPISNAYVPALRELATNHADAGLQIIGINSNAGQSLKAIQAHALEYQIAFPVVKDVGGRVAKKCGAATCPEAVLLDKQGKVIYRGRVDDRFVRRGGAAGKVGREDLAEAVRAHLKGEPVAVSRTETLGCPIDLPREMRPSTTVESSLTFHRDIARLLQDHCQECHRPGGIGPFALMKYDEAARWSEDIKSFTASGQMPPWKAADGFGEFAHPRRMPKEDVERIARWVDAGCPEGNAADAPAPKVFRDGWKLGREPDLVLEIPEYTLAAEGPDEYRCFILPTKFAEDRYVTAMEVLPGNSRVVHHVIAFLDTSGRARQLDERDEGPGYVTSAGFPGFFPAGGLGGWAPGNQPTELPSGMARVLPKGADVALQIHYHRSGKTETDRTRIGLYFSRTPVDRAVRNLPVLPLGGPLGDMRIPANDDNYEVKTTFVLPNDVLGIAVTPHMHLLGKDMELVARLPNGSTKPIIRVDAWDFNWQETYAFREPIALPRGTRLELRAHFDNSVTNPYNPHRPPTEVLWGESTDEEMCIAFLEVVPQRRAASAAELRPPTREEQLRMLFESRMLDDQASKVETFLLWTRFLKRMTNLERTGGIIKTESP